MNEHQAGEVAPQAPPQSQPAPQPESEKMIAASRVNDIAEEAFGRGKQKGYQLAKAEPVAPTVPHGTMDHAAMQKLAEDTFAKKQAEYMQQVQLEAQRKEGERVLSELETKMNEARSRIPDFDEKVKALKLEKTPEVLWYLNTVDNAGDVAYDMAKNPWKIANLRSSTPDHAALLVKQLSDSVKTNQSADATKMPPEPLAQIKPGNQGSDKQATTAADFRAKYRGIG